MIYGTLLITDQFLLYATLAKYLYYLYHNSSKYISVHQHGFIKARSTTTNLVCFSQFVAEALDGHLQADVIYTDFSKAFDKLDHNILLNKLNRFGISDALIDLFKSYLHNRVQYVAYNGFKSSAYNATSGVPQGSVLGPLFFILFINDITDVIDVNILLYADDLKLYTTIHSSIDCIRLQNNLDVLNNWCRSNGLPLNIAKCNVLSFTLKSVPIIYDYGLEGVSLSRPDTFNDLGVTFDSKLSFIPHIHKMCLNASKTYGFISRNNRDFCYNTLKLLFYSFIRSRLEYAAVVWTPYYMRHTNYIENVQRKFLKLLSFKLDGVFPSRGVCHSDLLEKHDISSLQTRRDLHALVFLFKIVNNLLDSAEILGSLNFVVPRVSARTSHTFYLPTARTNIKKRSPLYNMCVLYNSRCINFDLFGGSITALKDIFV